MAKQKTEVKKDAAAEPAAEKKKNKRSGAFGFIFFMIVFGASVPFFMPTFALILVGMIPTLVALFTDDDPNKSSTIAVGAMNAAGLTPFVIDLWTDGQTMSNAFHILREPINWLVIFGAAGIGQLIVFAVPQAVASLSLNQAEARVKHLRKNLASLEATWGPDVGTTKPLEKMTGFQ